MLLALLMQVAADVPPRFSILQSDCVPGPAKPGEIVVCARPDQSTPRLPMPDDRGPPDRPAPSNPKLDGVGALAAEVSPCATMQKGCQVGIGPPPAVVAAAIGAVADAIHGLTTKKPDRTGRVAIPLDGPGPAGSITR